jgi:hypothetical protein
VDRAGKATYPRRQPTREPDPATPPHLHETHSTAGQCGPVVMSVCSGGVRLTLRVLLGGVHGGGLLGGRGLGLGGGRGRLCRTDLGRDLAALVRLLHPHVFG